MMAAFQEFHFLRPLWFLALLPALLLYAGLWLQYRRGQQWLRYIAPNLLPYLLDRTQVQQRKWPLLGLLGLWILTVIALAGPVWQKIPQPVERNTQALVICWDLSPSMLAEDVKPSRLMRARLKLIDLLQTRREGQVALIAYSGEAYTVTPLTDDRQTLINLLPALSPTTLPSVGSNPEMALTQALQLLKDGGVHRGDILFLTDEIEPVAMEFMADELKSTPHQLTLWGVGTEQGAPIPLPEGGFAKNRQGEMVVARLNEGALQNFAKRQGFYYLPMLPTGSDIETLTQLLSPQVQDTQRTDRVFDQWFEHGQYLCLLLLPGIAWLFRRGLVFAWLAVALLPLSYSPHAKALDWQDLWFTQDQQAQRQLQEGDSEAAKRFSTSDRRGSALYQQQEYGEAAAEFAARQDAIAAYNQGNALTRAGQYEEAIKAFDKALQQQPSFAQAADNRAIAEELAKLQKQQEEQQDTGEENSDKQDGQQQESEEQKGEQKQQGSDKEKSEGQEGDSSQQGGEPQEMSEEEAEKRMAQQREEQRDKEQQDKEQQAKEKEQQALQKQNEENPYSQAKPLDAESQQAAEEDIEETDEKPAGEVAGMEQPMTEEQQMLEQWLRKVPDDPSGLMRNKFKYQHLQRRQSLRDPSNYPNNQAEQRW
jgi:Ca-activated chloride channel family protein